MQVPPVQFDLSTEKTDPPLPRMQWVWVLSIIVFTFLIVSSLATHDRKSLVKESGDKMKDKMLEMQLATKSLMPNPKQDRSAHMFDPQIDDLLQDAKSSSSAQKLRIVLRREDGQTPFKDDIKNLAKSKNPGDQAFAKLFSDPMPKKDEALGLLKQINGSELSERLATVQVKETYGDKEIRAKTFDPSKVYGLAILFFFGTLGLVIGSILWYIYFFQRQAGRLLPKGMPMVDIDWGRAERLMFVGIVILMTFAVSSYGFAKIAPQGSSGLELIVYAPIFAAIAVCLKVPIFGWKITTKSVGLSLDRFPEKVGWAVAAFFANIPIMLGFIIITAALSQFLPGGSHPVSEELLKNPKPMELAKIAFLACVVAPIWEEFFFRGLLFPAFTKAFGKPLYGALLSSFIFASIHPQGLLGVPVLMGIALMLCAVSYQTKSLVSNIILHGLHNGATLIAALVLAPLIS
jgi:membrane protease YdiL (CAAX protease family)